MGVGVKMFNHLDTEDTESRARGAIQRVEEEMAN
jgi:hypothetical protein